jgi:hypothetical protein
MINIPVIVCYIVVLILYFRFKFNYQENIERPSLFTRLTKNVRNNFIPYILFHTQSTASAEVAGV